MADREETFGQRLKRLREAAGLTQLELADAAGMHRFGVAKLERDEYSPSWDTVQALCQGLGISCAVFEGTVKPPPGPKPPMKRGRPKKQTDEGATPEAEEPAPPKRRKGK
jgi:transcriptional regulator with XRE-family HTH domain